MLIDGSAEPEKVRCVIIKLILPFSCYFIIFNLFKKK